MSVIGNQPGQASQRIPYIVNVTTTTATFTVPNGYMLGYLDVLVNGVDMVNGDDFTASDGLTFTLTVPAVAGDTVKMVTWIPRGLSDGYLKSEADAKYPTKANNLSDLASASAARTNLGLGSLATVSPSGTPNGSKFLRDDNTWQTLSVTPTAVSSQANTATDYFALPSGTTAQRPGTPVAGAVRYNSTLALVEMYSGGSWVPVGGQTYSVDYLVVAGGAAGGTSGAGVGIPAGGGAGGYQSVTGFSITAGQSYVVTVGAGGAATAGGTAVRGASGGVSSFLSTTSIGGGGGSPGRDTNQQGNNGGSGGGGGGGGAGTGNYYGSGTAGQGNYGGLGSTSAGAYGGGGGGGAGANGSNGASNAGGNGGAGSAWLNGTTYAGGGGGGVDYTAGTPGSGGSGGGGAGAQQSNTATSGTANTGGGGGGGGGESSTGGSGGSGVVIIRYQSATQKGTGGTVTSSGGYYYHTFTSSGTFTA